jgi:hypothetical protein
MLNTYRSPYPAPLRDRRFAGLALTVLVHAALVLCWQVARRLPPSEPQADPVRTTIQWIQLQPRQAEASKAATPARPEIVPAQPKKPLRAPAAPITLPAAPATVANPPATAAPSAPAASAATPAAEAAPPATVGATTPPTARQILERARRDAGSVDRALRKENNPYITAPLDSPQIRMRKGMEQANELAPNRLWEAPKVQELVNNTGDGARRTRVITGGGTYCLTERAPTTSIDMIEKHGKLRITSCPAHESPASNQEWRTARD